MAVCTFFGHRNCSDTIRPILYRCIEDLIVNHNVTMFYVGNQGCFDALVRSVLKEMMKKHPSINCAVVLSYMPLKTDSTDDFSDTMLPEGIEKVPPRFAIAWRNDWMLRNADYVICYITHSWGGAAQYVGKAKRQNKTVISVIDCTC